MVPIHRFLLMLLLGCGLTTNCQAAPTSPVLDAEADPRLNVLVSVTGHHTTVGAVLAVLGRETGVRLSAGSAKVREEPVMLFLRQRSLRSILSLLAEQFRWGEKFEDGWSWRRRGAGQTTRYELEEDLKTRLAAEALRDRDRKWFAEDLARMSDPTTPLPMPPYSPSEEQLVAALPPSLIAAALAGKPASLRWKEMPELLRRHASLALAPPNGGAGNDSWVEVQTEGAGASLRLSVMFQNGTGGTGPGILPEAYLHRFHPSAPLPGSPEAVDEKPKSFTGLAAKPVQPTEEDRRDWPKLRTLPALLELLARTASVEFIADDFGYTVAWGLGQKAMSPNGEPLGVWLDQLPQIVHTSPGLDHSLLKWREQENCILLRSADWYAHETERPPAPLRAQLRALRREGNPRVLNLDEAAELVSSLDVRTVGQLQWSGDLRPEQFHGRLSLLKFWRILPPLQRGELFSEKGLRIGMLPPNLRAAAITTGPGLVPLVSEQILTKQMGGDATYWFHLEDGFLKYRMRSAVGSSYEAQMDLRLPEEDPEVLLVVLEKSRQ